MSALLSSFTSRLLKSSAASGLLSVLEQCDSSSPQWLRVLTYHRVAYPRAQTELFDGIISATPEDFAAQMRCLKSRFHVVGMDEVLAAVRGQHTLPPRAVLITFDDGYRDFQLHAVPILSELALPATLFVATAYPDQPQRAFWWDRIHQAVLHRRNAAIDTPIGTFAVTDTAARNSVVRKLANHVKTLNHEEAMRFVDSISDAALTPPHWVLGWDDLRLLAREKITVAAHTRTHPLLTRLSASEAREEIAGSWSDIQHYIPNALPVFAYPDGACNDKVAAIAQDCGFELAFTTRRGINRLATADQMQLRRINVGRRSSPGALRLQMLTWSRHLMQ